MRPGAAHRLGTSHWRRSLPSPPPLHCARSPRQRGRQLERRRRGGDSRLQPWPQLRVLPGTQEEEADTAPDCEGVGVERARVRKDRARARTSRDPISRRRPARKLREGNGGGRGESRDAHARRGELLWVQCRLWAAAGLQEPATKGSNFLTWVGFHPSSVMLELYY